MRSAAFSIFAIFIGRYLWPCRILWGASSRIFVPPLKRGFTRRKKWLTELLIGCDDPIRVYLKRGSNSSR